MVKVMANHGIELRLDHAWMVRYRTSGSRCENVSPVRCYLQTHLTTSTPQMDFESSLRNEDERGILRSHEYFNTLIKEQLDKGIRASRIVIGGFSQGGAMSVFSGLANKEKLGGVFGLSCYLLLSDRIRNYIPDDWPNKKTPFFLAHGTADSIVLHKFGSLSARTLKELGAENVEFKSYPYVIYFISLLSPSMAMLMLVSVNSITAPIPMRLKTCSVSSRKLFLPKADPPRACDFWVILGRRTWLG